MKSHSPPPNIPLSNLFTATTLFTATILRHYCTTKPDAIRYRPGTRYMLLYSKSDKVPAHWPCRTLGPTVHVSPPSTWVQWWNIQGANQRHVDKSPRKARTTGLPQQARARQARIWRAHLELASGSPRAHLKLVVELAHCELVHSELEDGDSPQTCFLESVSVRAPLLQTRAASFFRVHSPLRSLPPLWLDNITSRQDLELRAPPSLIRHDGWQQPSN